MIEYPKIETLYNREETGGRRVLVDQLRLPEFANIKRWHITEKVDGTNVRVGLSPDGTVTFGGRTDNAQMPVKLMEVLRATFTPEKMNSVFASADRNEVTLFGEGYGEKIQNGGGYRKGVAFRLFDVLVGRWWLERDAVADVAMKLGISTVPSLGFIDFLPRSAADLESIFRAGILGNVHHASLVALEENGAPNMKPEGIVARTSPMLLTRRGDRLMWKLKFRDFSE